MSRKTIKAVSVRSVPALALALIVVCAALATGWPASGPIRAEAATSDYMGWNNVKWSAPNSFKQISAIDANNAWATDGMSVFRLSNGGTSWMQWNPGGHMLFNSVYGIDPDTAWATGYRYASGGAPDEDGLIVKFTNGGRNCDFQASGTTEDLNDISAVDQLTAWAVGDNGTIIKTEDGGATWNPQNSGVTQDLGDISVVSPQVAWAASSSEHLILRTVDGGANWTAKTVPSIWTNHIEAISADTAWATAYNNIYRTTDGGQTWAVQYTTDQFKVMGLSATDESNAWAVGANNGYAGLLPYGVVLNTADGGTNWVQQNTGYINAMSTISSGTPQSVWVGGNGTVLIRKGGANDGWGQVQCAVVDKLRGLAATDAGTAWICGEQGILAKVDIQGGYRVWKTGASLNLWSIAALDSQTAWAVGDGGAILKTTNGGFSWAPQSSGVTSLLYRVRALDAQTLWAVGHDGVIIKSGDAGATWHRQDSGTTSALYDISAVDQDTAWAVGISGIILKTTDGGATWQLQTPVSTDLYGVAAADADNVWVVGGLPSPAQSTILKTGDGGGTWVAQDPGQSYPVISVSAADADTAWCVTTGTAILKTTNSGTAWGQQYTSGANNEFASKVEAVDGMSAWALVQGQLLYTSNGGDKPPMLRDCVPFYGATGDEVIITGSDFGSVRGSSFVTFGTVEATDYTAWSFGEIRVIVPAGLSGLVSLSVTTPVGSASFTDEFNTEPPPLSVTYITPASGAFSSTVHITNLAGHGFKNGATVRLVQGDVSITATDILMYSGYNLACNFNLTGASVGAYDVVVTNPGGQEARLAGAFTVTLPLSCGTGAFGTLFVIGGMVGLLSLGRFSRRRRRPKR